ncbi:MAG TPA: glycosyltransferase [Usitatibacter sp.]|nr:glycosyltransferase [Usitatibacter sp.]
MIHLIIPTHDGLAATRPCIEAVLAAQDEGRLVPIVLAREDDSPMLLQWLQGLAERGEIDLRIDAPGTGWAAAANAVLEARGVADTLLLQGAPVLPAGWRARLLACLHREPHVATVCPFVERSPVASYRPFAAAPAAALGALGLDALFAAQNRGECIDIPVAHAACVLFAAAALRAAGPFDAAAFRDDGAVEDFCLRAARAGFRHLLCGDLFIAARAPEPGASIQARLEERHPGFGAMLERFHARDAARPLRRRVDLARLRASPRPHVLMVTHDYGGGVQRHVDDLARLLEADCEVLRLRPAGAEAIEIRWLRAGEELIAWAGAQSPGAALDILRALGVDRVHLHHVHGLPPWILELPGWLGVPHDVTLHDYFPACPRYHLSPGADGDCDDARGRCSRCLDQGPDAWGWGLQAWRERFGAFLRAASRVIAPSHDVAARIQRYFPGLPVHAWSHPERPLQPAALFKVAMLGGISEIKGARVLEACVEDARQRGLPLHFHVIGHVDRPMPLAPAAPLTVGGSYADDDLARVIALERPDAWLFLSRVPETYSYTLSAALATGLPVVATALGAFAERLRDVRHAHLVAVDATAGAINDVLLAQLRRTRVAARPRVASPQ